MVVSKYFEGILRFKTIHDDCIAKNFQNGQSLICGPTAVFQHSRVNLFNWKFEFLAM